MPAAAWAHPAGARASPPRSGRRARIARSGHGVHIGRALGDKWKQNRFRSVYLRNALWQNGYAVDTAETAVDWPRVGAMMQAIEQAATGALAAFGERLHCYTHLSHLYAQGASVYSTFVWRLARRLRRRPRALARAQSRGVRGDRRQRAAASAISTASAAITRPISPRKRARSASARCARCSAISIRRA